MSGALILTGAPGVGKSAVLEALSTLLEIDRVPFGALEEDELSRGWPWLSPGEWLPQLAWLIESQRQLGRETFLVTATTENEQELRAVIDAVGAEPALVVCLTAPAEVVAGRVADREPDEWPGKPDLIDHSRVLAEQMPLIPRIDALISTDGRDARDVAAEVKQLLVSRGIV